jgi:hypothetical protein
MEDDDERLAAMREDARQRRRRSVAIALALVGLVILFFVMSLVRLHATFH